MGVETAPGNEHNGAHCMPGLWRLIDSLPRDCWPALLRGDSGMVSEKTMWEAESRGIDFLFKLRMTKNVKALIERVFHKDGWHNAGQGWQGKTEALRLQGWSRSRRVVVLRRRLKGSVAVSETGNENQLRLSFADIGEDTAVWEYAVLVTSLNEEVLSIAQLYRDRADPAFAAEAASAE
jgi:hypothetical protein